MYKNVCNKPDWLKSDQVKDIYSVSGCVSTDFDDWINYWKHNGYWFFDYPSVIETIAKENSISLHGMKLFYYRAFEKQWDEDTGEWTAYEPEKSFETNVQEPKNSKIVGYDIVSFHCQANAECSPLSCNHLAQDVKVNSHCLLFSFEEAKELIESGALKDCEPGPYRIFEVYTVENA